MRILAIELKNLNSLMGQWYIDLSDSAYSTDGLFAITGPTGAGKSTLLDAICLALYGQTPRLGKLSKSNNEILSRHCVECFAEVTFETVTGRWRCRWSQHRSRKKASGALQEPKHELVRADTGEIVEASLRGVTEQVEHITGMDFERFTRAMLLAQGGFASFLQSSPDKRSPLLEQITGTTIYSDISKRVFERHRDAQQQRQWLQTGLNGLHMMADDEALALEQQLSEHSRQAQALERQLQHTADGLRWHARVQQLQQQSAEQAQQAEWLQARSRAFAPLQQQLQIALQAQELAPAHQQLQGLRGHIHHDRHALQQWQAQWPQLEQAATHSQAQEQYALQQEQAAKTAWQTAQPTLRQVREWDWRITAEQRQQQELMQTLQSLAAQASEQALQQRTEQQLQARHQHTRQQLQQAQTQQAQDAHLVEHLSALNERLRQLAHQQKIQTRQHQEWQQSQNLAAQAQAQWQQATQAEQALQQACLHSQTQRALPQQQLQDLLAQHSLQQWHQRKDAQSAEQQALTHCLQTLEQWQTQAEQQNALQTQQQALAEQRSALNAQLETSAAQLVPQERELQLLQRQLELEIRIETLEAHRHSLEDGQACPLCGALEHPFVQHAPAGNASHTQQEIVQRSNALQALKREHDARRLVAAQQHRESELLDTELQRLQHALARQETLYRAAWQACTHIALAQPDALTMREPAPLHRPLASAQQQILHKALQAGQAQLAQTERTIAQAHHLESQLARLQQAQDRAQSSWEQGQRATQEQLYRKQQLQDSATALEHAASQLALQVTEQQQALQSELQVFGLHDWTAEQAMQALAERRSQWLARQHALATCESELAALAQTLAQRQQALEALAQQQQAYATQQQQTAQSEQQMQAQRRQQLGTDASADALESRLQSQLAQAQAALEQARAQHSDAKQMAANAQARSKDIQARLQGIEQTMAEHLSAFFALLQTHQFASEAAYEAALLPHTERTELAAQAKALELEHTTLQAQQAATAQQLAELQEQPPTELAEAALHTQQTLWQHDLHTQQTAMAQARHRLGLHAEMQKQQASQLQALEAQHKECERWEHLHALIGSADGKKYRNFAQGLTFEVMVQHANQQLRSLSDRYLLVRDSLEPLALNVIDTYQNAELRSTKTLSGGESFLVSLALALGLSRMASQNVRIDSLFLDEGFGSLDEDALETALETLASLHHEGKLIGVISHVSALKERIATQIQVVPLAGGKSALRGPGCRLVAA